jgi:hypothetical protein
MKTFLLKEDGNKQSFITPQLSKVYENWEYRVYKSHFDSPMYLIYCRRTKKCVWNREYNGTNLQKLDFNLSVLSKF